MICAVVTHRGVGMPLNTSRFWHPAHTDDVALVLGDIQSLFSFHAPDADCSQSVGADGTASSSSACWEHADPPVRVFLVGYSAGSNILLQTVLKKCGSLMHLIAAAMCVCVTYDYKQSVKNLETTFIGRTYSGFMAMLFKETVIRNAPMVLSKSRSDEILAKSRSCTKLSEFDTFASTALYGYSDSNEYFTDCSAFDIDKVSLPLLVVQPQDDPLHHKHINDNIDVAAYIGILN